MGNHGEEEAGGDFYLGYQKETLSHKQNANKKASYFDIFNRYHPFSSQDLGKDYLTFHKLSFMHIFFICC